MQHRHKLPFKGTHTNTHLLSHRHLQTESWENTFSIYSYECECLVSYFLLLYFLTQSCLRSYSLSFFALWHQAHHLARLLDATVDFEEIFWSSWSHRNVLTLTQQLCLSLSLRQYFKYSKALTLCHQKAAFFAVFQWVSVSWTITPVRASG